MSCESKFTSDVSLSCVLSLMVEIRKGVTAQTITQALWLAGCLITKLSPPNSSSDTPEAGTISGNSQDVSLDDLYRKCEDLQSASIASSAPSAGTQGWEVFIPIILEIIKIIIENRKKNPQPAPKP